jgi:hypothetical protein
MDIDARLKRMAQRDEALAQSLRSLLRVIEQDSQNIAAIGMQVQPHCEEIRCLVTAVQQDAENIRALVRIAEIHERRLSGVEGGADR